VTNAVPGARSGGSVGLHGHGVGGAGLGGTGGFGGFGGAGVGVGVGNGAYRPVSAAR